MRRRGPLLRFTFLHGLILSLVFMVVLMGLSFYALLLREALTACRIRSAVLENAVSLAAAPGSPGIATVRGTLTANGATER